MQPLNFIMGAWPRGFTPREGRRPIDVAIIATVAEAIAMIASYSLPGIARGVC